MSPNAVNDLAHSFVEMAKAYEQVPILEREIAEARTRLNDMGDHIQRLELRAHERNGEIERLHETIRQLEVSRDDAELRFLELDEKVSIVTHTLRGAQAALGEAIVAFDPPKPQPEAVPEVVKAIEEVHPFEDHGGGLSQPMGQSEADPTATSVTLGTQASALGQSENAMQTQPTSPGPYFGKRYIDITGWVSREDWLARGGTNEDYDYRGESRVG